MIDGKRERAVFLDRDGVINKVVMRQGMPCSPRSVKEFEWEEGAREAIASLKEHGLILVVITNQPDVARGKMSQESLKTITQMIYSQTKADDVFVCRHDDSAGCRCRKPEPGMLLEAAKRWHIDCDGSFMVGDGWKDMGAGQAAGCRTILLDRPYNQGVMCDYRVQDLEAAVEVILRELYRSEMALRN